MTHKDGLDELLLDPDAIHTCDDPECPVNGVRVGDLPQLQYALTSWYDARETLDVVMFRGLDGLYAILIAEVDAGTAVVGALYTPGLYRELRDGGYTRTNTDGAGGVN